VHYSQGHAGRLGDAHGGVATTGENGRNRGPDGAGGGRRVGREASRPVAEEGRAGRLEGSGAGREVSRALGAEVCALNAREVAPLDDYLEGSARGVLLVDLGRRAAEEGAEGGPEGGSDVKDKHIVYCCCCCC